MEIEYKYEWREMFASSCQRLIRIIFPHGERKKIKKISSYDGILMLSKKKLLLDH